MKTGFKSFVVCMLFVISLFAGCRTKKTEEAMEILPAEKTLFFYEGTEEADGIAVEADGTLYTISWIKESDNTYQSNYTLQKISVYDLEGTCIRSAEIRAGNGRILCAAAKDGKLYFLSGKSLVDFLIISVYEVDTTTWEVNIIGSYPQYGLFITEYCVILEDYLYVLGSTMWSQVEEEELDILASTRKYNVVFRVHLTEEDPQAEEMDIRFPNAIYVTEDDTLMLHVYTQEKGFVFYEFDPQEKTLVERYCVRTDGERSKVIGCRNGYFYSDRLGYGDQDEIFFQTYDSKQEEGVLLVTEVDLNYCPVYRGGFLFYSNQLSTKSGVWRICVENVAKKGKELILLERETAEHKPFPCGFLMKERAVSQEEFALKVLALDKDFDLFVMDSGAVGAEKVRDSGIYYPLNDVEGVQEYLDACFPSLKELAINEEGDIWMLPVKIGVSGLVYNKTFCEKQGVDLSSMDWTEYVDFIETVCMEEGGRYLLESSIADLAREFCNQYLALYHEFDTEEFRIHASRLRKSRELGWNAEEYISVLEPLKKGIIPDYYFTDWHAISSYQLLIDSLENSDIYGVAEIPKISEEVGNTATVVFLVVNPMSQKLDTALEYITAYAKYMMTVKNSFLLSDRTTYSEAPFVQELYTLFSNAEFYFDMDDEIYWNIFLDYINGKTELEETIKEMERRRKLYYGE